MTLRTATLIALSASLVACNNDFVADAPQDDFVADAPSDDTALEDTALEDTAIEDTAIEDDPIVDTGDEPLEAAEDNDSFDDPLFEETFLGSGAAREFTAEDDISAPFGDREDWIAFTTPALENEEVNISLDLVCDGSPGAYAQVWDDEGSPAPLSVSYRVSCEDSEVLRLETNHDYLVRVYYPSPSDADYTVWNLQVSW